MCPILESWSWAPGHGGVSRQLLADHPSARVTVTDVDPESVARIAAGDLGSHPRAEVRQMDATAIDAADGSYDLVLFALSFHHLPPAQAARVFAEGTRVADTLLIIDLPRPPAPLHLLRLATMLPGGGRCFRSRTTASSAHCAATAPRHCAAWPATPTRRSSSRCAAD